MKELTEIFNEYMDYTDRETASTLVSIDEADKGTILSSLTSKLYDKIVENVDDIDFGTIPLSKGDITKIENYESMLDCLEVIKNIVIEYRQPTDPIDIVLTAIENIKSRTRTWEKAYALNAEFPILIYNTIVLSVVASLSIMIGTSIDFIKNPGDQNFQASLDKVAYNKSKNNLLFSNLAKFNKSCVKGDIDRSIDHIFKTTSVDKNLVGSATLTGVGIVALVCIAKNILPILQELVFFAYHAKQNVSDYFAIQADLLQSNANTLQYKELDADKRKEVFSKQNKIADRFRKISNALAIKTKRAEVETGKSIKDSSKKYTTAELVDTKPDSVTGSSLF